MSGQIQKSGEHFEREKMVRKKCNESLQKPRSEVRKHRRRKTQLHTELSKKLEKNKRQTKHFTEMLHWEGIGITVNREHWAEELRRFAKDNCERENHSDAMGDAVVQARIGLTSSELGRLKTPRFDMAHLLQGESFDEPRQGNGIGSSGTSEDKRVAVESAEHHHINLRQKVHGN